MGPEPPGASLASQLWLDWMEVVCYHLEPLGAVRTARSPLSIDLFRMNGPTSGWLTGLDSLAAGRGKFASALLLILSLNHIFVGMIAYYWD